MSRGKFTRIFPDDGALTLDGGKNSKFERSLIGDNESPDCLNVVFDNGAAATRQGAKKLNTAAIGSFAFDGLYTRRADTGAETMVAFAGGSAWQLGGTSFSTIGSAQSVFTAGARVGATQYENHLFMGNGGVIPYKWNGTDFTRHGVYPPSASFMTAVTASVASNGVGSLDASSDYRYKFTFVNSQLVESDVGQVTTTFTISATSGQNRLTSIPVAPQSWGVSTRRIYRTEGNGSIFKRVIELGNNTATTYDDNIPDASLGATAPTDKGVPPLYSVIAYHQNRLFMNDPSNPNYLVYTDLGEPYTVAALNFRKLGDAAGDLVKTISVYENGILVGCEKSHWFIYMPSTDPAEWQDVRIKSPYGSKSPYGMFDFNGKKMVPVVEGGKFVGFAAFSGQTVEQSAAFLTVGAIASPLATARLETDMFSVQDTYLGNISAITFKNRGYITLTYGSGNTTNNRVYYVDFSAENLERKQSEAWVPFTGWNAAQFTIYDNKLYFASSTASGFVYQCESGSYNDDSAAIDSYLWTKEFSGYKEDLNRFKDFRQANILIEKPGDYYMNVTYRTDSDSGLGTTSQINLDPGGSLWGVLVWGTDSWGGARSQEDYTLDLGVTSGKRIQFKFSNQNTVDQMFKVHRMNFTYNAKGLR